MSETVVLITGGNGGLGLAMAEAFLRDGAVVFLGVRQRRDRAEALPAKWPERAHIVPLEVIDPAAWKRAVETILGAHGRIDVLVNNAGEHRDALLAMMPPADWEQVTRTTLDGAFHGSQAVLPAMISQRSGRIINISSLSGLLAPAGQTNYAAAKAGLIAMTQSLAKEVARMGITVNAVCPGYVATEALSKMSAEDQRQLCGRIPMRRLGHPAEVAALVRFLACAEAAYITGSAIKIDGGIL